MAFVLANNVAETTTTTGTGDITLAGAKANSQSFNSGIGVGNTTLYAIRGQGDWEVGLGTLSASTTLQRTTVIASSNSNSAVSFAAGTKDVICVGPVDALGVLLLGYGIVAIGDTANANMTVGLTINQGANDDEALALKSSDVAHALTQTTETDTYGTLRKLGVDNGGLQITGVTESAAARALRLVAFGGQPSTTPSSDPGAALSTVVVLARPHDGANAFANYDANALVFGVAGRVAGSDRNLFFIDEDGDLHVDGSTSPAAFDAYADAELVRAFDLTIADPAQIIRSKWDEAVRYGRDALVKAGILSDPESGDPMVNVTQLQRLHNGAIWQLYTRNRDLEERVDWLSEKLDQALRLLEHKK